MTVNFTEDDNSLLVLLLDTNPYIWGARKSTQNSIVNSNSGTSNGSSAQDNSQLDFSTFIEQTFVFLNTYLMLKQHNALAIIASHVGESKLLYPKPGSSANVPTSSEFSDIKTQIVDQLKKMLIVEPNLPPNHKSETMLSGALSLALCYIHRISKEKPLLKPRILVLQVSPDVSAQYIAIMNCIFSAQKKTIMVDSCLLSQSDSSFLQQASHITGGIYLKLANQEGYLQYLLSCFLPDPYTRKQLNLPTQTKVDYRASCFCHKKVIDTGFVCSVCLSIFCSFTPICTTCGSRFMLPQLLAPKKKKKTTQ